MLTLKNYDHAVVNFLKDFETANINIVWGTPAEAFQNSALANNDEIKLPLISVYRSDLALYESQNDPLFRRGSTVKVNMPEMFMDKERVLMFQMTYVVDIWAIDPEQCAAIFAEMLFMMLDDPKVLVRHEGVPYEIGNYLKITDIADNTDSISQSDRGRLNRYTITFQLPAHIAKLERHQLRKIVPELSVANDVNPDEPDIIPSVIEKTVQNDT